MTRIPYCLASNLLHWFIILPCWLLSWFDFKFIMPFNCNSNSDKVHVGTHCMFPWPVSWSWFSSLAFSAGLCLIRFHKCSKSGYTLHVFGLICCCYQVPISRYFWILMNQNYCRHIGALHSVTEIKLQISNLFSAVFPAFSSNLQLNYAILQLSFVHPAALWLYLLCLLIFLSCNFLVEATLPISSQLRVRISIFENKRIAGQIAGWEIPYTTVWFETSDHVFVLEVCFYHRNSVDEWEHLASLWV